MFNYLIKIEYDGTNFTLASSNGKSIQDTIEFALKSFKFKIRISTGRTDKGVHAYSQYANFKSNNKILNIKKF